MQCQLNKVCKLITPITSSLQSVALLALRLMLAYSFYGPAMMKIEDIDSVAMWFGSMGIPLPTLNAYMATATEMSGVVLLTLGLFTRLISLPLIVVMLVAIATVHGVNGFEMIQAGSEIVDPWVNGEQVKGTIVILQNGFEIPLYYILMLLVLLSHGGGKISLDYLFFSKKD